MALSSLSSSAVSLSSQVTSVAPVLYPALQKLIAQYSSSSSSTSTYAPDTAAEQTNAAE